jgi:hypothetical protein
VIGVGFKTGKKKVKVLERFGGNEMDAATELAQALARHNSKEYLVFLINGSQYRILKKVKVGWRLAFPSLRHPFRYPSRGVITR